MEDDDYFHIKTDDIYQEGWHSFRRPAHHLFFLYLRISPSYELARKASKGRLSTEEKKRLPKDFKKVQETYALLGDVQNTLFRYWWQKVGDEVFGVPHEYPTVDVISVLDGSVPRSSQIQNDVADYLKTKAAKAGNSPALIISIPLDNDSKSRMQWVKKYLMEYKDLRKSQKVKIKPKIELKGKRINQQALVRGWGLLIFKSAFLDMENWRLGVAANLSPSYSPVLKVLGPRKTTDSREAQDRVLMGKITHRSLKKYQSIAENAARGNFPSESKIKMAFFDYEEINQLYEKTKKWEEKELQRVKLPSK
jgi:hypothetical protein